MRKEQLLYEMMWYIQNKKIFTAQELADQFHLSVRSVYRYISDLADLGLYVESQQGRHGGFKVLSNQILPPVLFTEDEIISLYFAMQSLENYQDFPFKLNTVTAREKLLAVIPQKTRNKLNNLSDRFQILTQKQVVQAPFLNDLMAAALNQQMVEIDYQSKKQFSQKKLAPIGIYANNGFWYLFALDMVLAKTRHYRVDRISVLKFLQEKNINEITLNEGFANNVPQNPVRLSATLTQKGVQQCLENLFLHEGVEQFADGSGCISMLFDATDIPFTTDFFLLLGSEAKVSEPKEMVDLLKTKASVLQALYGKK